MPSASAGSIPSRDKLLGVPVSFFFEDQASNDSRRKSGPENLVQQFLSTRDGINLSKAFMSIDDKAMRRMIVAFVEGIANQPVSARGRTSVGRK
jgi:hypothetical protein